MASDSPGTDRRPLRVAIVGAGPAGFFAADALLKQKDLAISVDILNRFPTPYGLVRDGVAPDHQEIKAVTKAFDRVARDPRFRYYGNVTFGSDVTREDLLDYYDQVVYAVGAQADRSMGIPGEDLPGSLAATAFVGWYNGHPDYRNLDPDLGARRVVVVGNGNVAVDVTRILVKSLEDLARTDIADHALAALSRRRVEEVVVLGRRGPAQAAFTTPELRELGALEGVDVVVDPRDLELDPESAAFAESSRVASRNLECLREFAGRPATPGNRRIVLRFLASPVEIHPGPDGSVAGVRIERNTLVKREDGSLRPRGTGVYEELACEMVLRSVGYRCVPLAGVPFDEARGVLANIGGRITRGPSGPPLPGEYVVGWAKRGPSGVIGTNKADANDTVRRMLEDLPVLPPDATPHPEPEAAHAMILERAPAAVSWADWETLDAVERNRGALEGRPRVKYCTVREMMAEIRQDAPSSD